MSEADPPVSVVLRTYNHAPFIAQAIESVLIQQTPFPFELVVGEDCSTDGTREIVEAYGRRYPEIVHPVLPERNVGHGEMLRQALAACRGELIAYLDGDDYWTSTEKLARQREFLEANPDCHDCFHDVSLIYDEAGIPSGNVSPRFSEEQFDLEQIVMECFPPAPSMMFRRWIVEELDRSAFDSAWLDWVIHIRAAMRGPLGYIPEPLAAYRVHRGGMFSSLDRVSQLEEDIRFYGGLLEQLPEQRALIERCIAFRHAQLAVERLGIPFEACVVLADPRREFRPYFNGRHARGLPRRADREVTELEAIRQAASALPRAVEDYRSQAAVPESPQGCFLVVPAASAEWVRGRPALGDYLAANAQLVWDDQWVQVYGLETAPAEEDDRSAGASRRVRVKLAASLSKPPAAFLDAPGDGATVTAHAVTVAGWAVGEKGPAELVEFELDGGRVVWRTPVTRERPDVVEAFRQVGAGTPGFQTTLNVRGLPDGSRVAVFAVFAGGERVPIGELTFERPADGAAEPR